MYWAACCRLSPTSRGRTSVQPIQPGKCPVSEEPVREAPSAQRGGVHLRSMFLAMKRTLAGRSASRRMKYGYHSLPKGT